jgi:tetratricopeptide (TPR) repeat protein
MRDVRRAFGAAAVVVPVLLGPGAARADERTDIEKAYSAYVGHNYEEAEARLRALLDAKAGALKDPDNVADARMYLGAVLVAEGKKDQAAALFEALLVDKPEYEADPLRVSTQAIDAFLDVRARMRSVLSNLKAERVRKEQEVRAKEEAERQKAAARLAVLEKLAGEEVVRTKHSRWIALLPFGVGQFQNGQTALGVGLLAGEALLAAGSGIAAGITIYDANAAHDALQSHIPTADTYNGYAQTAAYVSNGLTVGFVVVALAGNIQAQIAFVPESVAEVRKRPVPSASVAPILGAGGVGLRF